MTKSFEFRCVTSPFPDNKVSDRLIFASYQIYNNSDFNLILDEIELYKDSGLDILYDDDFNPRMEWSNSIFYAISNCSVFVVFITPNCQKSQDFKAGIKLARTENIPIVVVYLSDTSLTGSFQSDLKDYPTIHKNKLSSSEYISECRNAFTNVKSSSGKDPISFKKFDRLIHRGKSSIELESDVILDSSESSDFEDGIKLDVRGLVVEGNGFTVDAKNNARVFELTGGDITFRNVTFKNAVARLGAVAHARRGSSCTFEDCTFEDNHSRADGGCFNNYGDLIFRNCTFKNNYSDEHGGAIINWGDIILEDCEFKNNSSKNFNGGAISNEESHNIKIVNTKFIDNSAKNGGAILNEGCTYVKNCEFKNNSSVEDGDSIHIKDGTATVKNSTFADSKSREIYEASGYHIDFTDCSFSGTRTSSNSSSSSSSSKSNFDALESLIRNAGSSLRLDRDFRLDSSEASRFEEGIEFDGVDITIDGAGHSIDGANQVRIFKMVNSGTVRLKNIKFKNGRSNLGAAVRCDSGTKVYIDDCLFEDNHSTGDGGGLRNNGPVVVRNTMFRNNVADKYGGAILNYDDLEIEDCTFENNRTGEFDGGAIYSDDKLRIRNSDFKNNTAENRGHDLCSVRSGTLEVRNSRFDKTQSSAIHSDNSPDIYGCDFSGSGSSSSRSSGSRDDFEYLSDLIHGSSKRISLNSDIVLGSNESSEFEDGIKFDVDNVTIDANGHTIDARDSVRAFKLTASDVTIRNARFINGESRLGAVCHASKGSSCTFEDCIFEDNHSRADGGTFNNYGDLIFRNCTFRNNVSDEHGGAIINWGDVILEDCEFKNNSSKNFNGGAISNESSHNIKIVNTHFENNRAKNGGAILNEGCCYVRDSTFKDNSCAEDGDGIHIKNGTATVKNSKFSGSKSREIYEVSGHYIDFSNCDFSSSSSGSSRSSSGGRRNFEYLDNLVHGGSKRITLEDDIVLDSSEASQFEKGIKLDVNNLVIDGNGHTIDAKGKVRIFDVSAGNVTLKNFNFKNGYSKLGGVIETDRHVHIKISHCTFEGNEAFGDGGAIRNWHEGDVRINDCTFRKNSSSDHGGAIFNYGNLEVVDSRFESNTAKNHNGGAIATDNKLLVKNCVFIDNTAPHRNGDSIYNDGSELFEAQNCKFSGNKNSEVGSSNSSKMKLKNCKFNDDGKDDDGKSGGGVVSKIFGRFRS